MSNDLKNILSNSNKDIDNQKLMDYVGQQLSKQQLHDIEKEMADDEFMNDAVEGLQEIKNQQNIPVYLDKINADLKKQIAKQQKKERRRWKDQSNNYIAIIIILLLLVVSFIVVKKYITSKAVKNSSGFFFKPFANDDGSCNV